MESKLWSEYDSGITPAGTSDVKTAGICDGQNVSPHLLSMYVLDQKAEKGVGKKSCNSISKVIQGHKRYSLIVYKD